MARALEGFYSTHLSVGIACNTKRQARVGYAAYAAYSGVSYHEMTSSPTSSILLHTEQSFEASPPFIFPAPGQHEVFYGIRDIHAIVRRSACKKRRQTVVLKSVSTTRLIHAYVSSSLRCL